MTNLLKYSTSPVTKTLSKGNFSIGINDSISYPDNNYVVGIMPPVNGYTVYNIDSNNIPNIYCGNDTDLMHYAVNLGATNINTVNDALNWFATQTNMLVTNMDYPNITTDGLVCHWDAKYVPSYPKNGTVVTDLAGSATAFSCVNGASYDSATGSINFAGGNQYLGVASHTINTGQDFTAIVWFYNQEGTGRGGLISMSYPYATNQGWYMFIRTTQQLVISVGMDQNYALSNNNLLANGNWYCAAITVSAAGHGGINGYLNNVPVTWSGVVNFSNSFTINYGVQPLRFGSTSANGTDYFIGNIAVVQIYNKVLSTTELTQNWNAIRTRFSL